MLELLRNSLKIIVGGKNYRLLKNNYKSLKRFGENPLFYIKHMNRDTPTDATLVEIGKYQGTDKINEEHSFAKLSYLDIYDMYFRTFRDKNISLLEIGVKDGASLRTWKSYFQSGSIFGIDIDPQCKELAEERINIEIGSQDDLGFLTNCFGSDKKFDVIIDDGSHINNFTIFSFEYLFANRLNSGGIYIIEDLQCSYDKLQTEHNILETWPGMKYNDKSKIYDNDRKDMDSFFLEKISRLDKRQGDIMSLHFWAMTCVILKI